MHLSTLLSRFAGCARIQRVGDGFLRVRQGNQLFYPVFPHKAVIVEHWNKNGVYYNLDRTTFPEAEHILLLSHPCDPRVILQFPEVQWYSLGERYLDEFSHITHHRLSRNKVRMLLRRVEAEGCFQEVEDDAAWEQFRKHKFITIARTENKTH